MAPVIPKVRIRDSEIDKSEFKYFVEISEAYKGSEELRNAFFEFRINLFITNLRVHCFNPFEDGNYSWNEIADFLRYISSFIGVRVEFISTGKNKDDIQMVNSVYEKNKKKDLF